LLQFFLSNFGIVNNLLLPLLIELDLFHVGIAEKISEPPGLTQSLLGDQSNRFLGACGYTGRIILAAHITFNRFLTVLVGEERAEGACLHAFIAGDAEFPVQSDDAVNPAQGVHRADIRARGFLTLAADNRHPDDRMGISYQDPDRTLLRVVDPEVSGGADQFADMAAGT
jgi:hypothetical protein